MATEPTLLSVSTSLFGTGVDERQIIITVKRAGVTEIGVLEPAHTARVFFLSPCRAVSEGLSFRMPPSRSYVTAALLLVITCAVGLAVFRRRHDEAYVTESP